MDSRQATRDLRHLVESGFLRMVGARGGAYYVLAEPFRGLGLFPGDLAPRERKVLAALASSGELKTSEIAAVTNLPHYAVRMTLSALLARGLVEATGTATHAPTRR